jgi:hypothetical protein
MNNVTTTVYTVKIETAGASCTFSPTELGVKEEDTIIFVNETNKQVSVTLVPAGILNTESPFTLLPGEEHSVGVEHGNGGQVKGTVNCDASSTVALKTSKPEIIINRE